MAKQRGKRKTLVAPRLAEATKAGLEPPATHQELLSRLRELQDLQASWLLLLFCASPRSNYILRMLPPPATTEFSTRHDAAVATCLTELLQSGPLPASALAIAHLPLSAGGLGLPAATINANAAHWGSWADTLPVLQRQLPSLALTITQQLCNPANAPPAIQAAVAAAQALRNCDWEPPSWDTLTGHNGPPPADPEPVGPQHRGWQQPAATAIHKACRAEVDSHLPPASQALLASQSGPYASRAFTSIPYTPESTYTSEHFRLLLLRRLRLPPPCPPGLVDAVALLTHFATIDQLARSRDYCAAAEGHSNEQQLAFVVRPGQGWPPTPG